MDNRRPWCSALLACQLTIGSDACARAADPVAGMDAGHTDPPAAAGTPAVADDQACLRFLDNHTVTYQRVPVAGGMRTPVEIAGPIGGIKLVARGRRSAVMDCVLARALVQAGDVFKQLGITTLAFSAAFDHRTRRGSNEASAHAYGLAIDVHVIGGGFGQYDVHQHFERGVGAWRGLPRQPGALDACVGRPATNEGRILRQLACRLKLHPAFRVIVTPDDDPDHQDHLHVEAGSTFFPPPATAPPLAPPPAPAEARTEPTSTPAQQSTAKRKRATKRKSLLRKTRTKKANPTKAKTTKAKTKKATKKPAPNRNATDGQLWPSDRRCTNAGSASHDEVELTT
jgi:hypothetical protein